MQYLATCGKTTDTDMEKQNTRTFCDVYTHAIQKPCVALKWAWLQRMKAVLECFQFNNRKTVRCMPLTGQLLTNDGHSRGNPSRMN